VVVVVVVVVEEQKSTKLKPAGAQCRSSLSELDTG
jgi:hypothetical protein